jgi:hypothetical protein
MSIRKKNAGLPRQGKTRQHCNEVPPSRRPLSEHTPDIEALLMVGTDHIVINQEENDNIGFMAELIEPI